MEKVKNFTKSKTFIYMLLGFFCLFLSCLSKNYDYDLYARLIVGEHFFSTGWISYKDFLSYTPTHPWYDHEWGSSLFFYAFLKAFGPIGLIILQAVTMFISVLFITKTQQLQRHAYPVSIAFMSVFLILFSHQNPSIVRCHMFSFMFFSILIYLLEKTRIKNSNMLWLMLPITIIWNNMHGGIVSGLGIIFIYMVGELLSKKNWKKYLAVLTSSTLLLVINPYGIEYLNFLFSANTMNREFITEWWPVFAKRHILYYYPQFCVGLFASILCLLEKKEKQFNLTKTLVLITTAILGTIHVKLLSLTLITVASLYYNEIICLFRKNNVKVLNRLTCLFITLAIITIPSTKPFDARVDINKYPVMEVEFLKQNKISGNILTLFGLGSYVSYKLYPQNLIYMDGRYEEVYNDTEFNNLINYELAKKDWDLVIKNYPTEILMPEIGSNIYNLLEKHPEWIKVYSGPICGIFLHQKSKHLKQNFVLPETNLGYYRKNEFKNLGQFGG